MLVVLATLVLVLAVVAGYARRALVDSDQFANRATAALRSEPVRTRIADRITDEVVLAHKGDLLAARPLIASVAEVLSAGARSRRCSAPPCATCMPPCSRATRTRSRSPCATSAPCSPRRWSRCSRRWRGSSSRTIASTVVREEAGGLDATLVAGARTIRTLSVVLALLWVALTAAALWVARDRRRTAVELGFGAALGGVAIALGCLLARAALAARVGALDEDAVKAVFDAFAGDLRTAGWVLAGCGAVVAAAGRSALKPLAAGEWLRRAAAWAGREPVAPAWRAAARVRARGGRRRRAARARRRARSSSWQPPGSRSSTTG